MPARLLVFVLSMALSVGLVAPVAVVDAQPATPAKKAPAKKAPAKKAPRTKAPAAPAKEPAPAKDAAPPPGDPVGAAGAADATAGAAVHMTEDPPPKDMSGV